MKRGLAAWLVATMAATGVMVATPEAAHAAEFEVSTITELQLALGTPAFGGSCAGTEQTPDRVTLTADISAPSFNLAVQCHVVLDLAGHDLAVRTMTIAAFPPIAGAMFPVGVTIEDTGSGGTLTADAGGTGHVAGIRNSAPSSLTINGGTVIAHGGKEAAGIGGEWPSSPSTPGLADFRHGGATTINGGTVVATGGDDAAGIGGGNFGDAGVTTINGGTVTARGRLGGAGIGPGNFGRGGTVTITGGDVTAGGDSPLAGEAGLPPGGPAFGGSGDQFGVVHIDGGTLRLPSWGWLTSNGPGTPVTIGPDAVVDGTAGPAPEYGYVVGTGRIRNSGSIRLPTSNFIDAFSSGAVVVNLTEHHYEVSFDTQGGSTPPAPVRVYAGSFAAGNRTFPADPSRTGHVFAGWNTAPDGSGAPVTASGVLPGGSANGRPVPITAYAQWQQLTVDLPVPTVSGTAELGETLSAHVGATTPPGATVTYEWLRVDRQGNTTVVPGATGSTYRVGVLDVGKSLQVRVTASAPDFAPSTKVSAPVGPVVGRQTGDDGQSSASTQLDLTVGPAEIVARVRGLDGSTPTGSVEFAVDGAPVGVAELAPAGAGQANAVLSFTVPAGAPREVTASYRGGPRHRASSASTTRTDPVVTATVTSRRPAVRGWYSTPVRVVFRCAPGTGEVQCPQPVRLRQSGAGIQVVRSVTATDGGQATVRVASIDIDRTKPTVRVKGIRKGGSLGAPRRVRCAASDAHSGVLRCGVTTFTKRLRGSAQLVRYRVRAVDVAGNRRTVRGSYVARR